MIVGRRKSTSRTQTTAKRASGTARRASLFRPVDLAGCVLWLRADQQVVQDANGLVSAWGDLSGQGNNVTQATAGSRPGYAFTGPGGKPVLTFSTANTLLTRSSAVLSTSPWTIFTVAQASSPGGTGYAFYVGNANASNGFGVGVTGNSRDVFYSGAAHLLDGAPTSGWEKVTVRNDGTTTTARVNGAPVALSNSTTQPVAPTALTSVGGYQTSSQDWNGSIAEVICFNRVLSAPEVSSVELYLQRRYQLGVS